MRHLKKKRFCTQCIHIIKNKLQHFWQFQSEYIFFLSSKTVLVTYDIFLFAFVCCNNQKIYYTVISYVARTKKWGFLILHLNTSCVEGVIIHSLCHNDSKQSMDSLNYINNLIFYKKIFTIGPWNISLLHILNLSFAILNDICKIFRIGLSYFQAFEMFLFFNDVMLDKKL